MSYSSEVLADSPAVYEDHQDTTGTAAVDSSGNSLNGTYNGTYVLNDSTDPACPVALGKHVRIDGTSGYFNTNTSTWFTPATNGCTFEGWFYIRSWSNWMRIWDFANSAVDDMVLAANNTGGMIFKVNGTSFTFSRFATGSWLHVVATVTTAGVAKIWVNNAVWASGTVGAPVNQARANKWTGRSAFFGSGDPYLAASVTQEAFYNSVLPASRIGAHYSVGVGGGYATLSLSGSGTATIPPSGAGSISLSGSASGAGGASATAALTLSAVTATPIQNYHGDTSNMLGGLNLGGGATVTITRPVASLPGHLSYGPKVDVAVALPAPTLVNGRPT